MPEMPILQLCCSAQVRIKRRTPNKIERIDVQLITDIRPYMGSRSLPKGPSPNFGLPLVRIQDTSLVQSSDTQNTTFQKTINGRGLLGIHVHKKRLHFPNAH